MYLKHFCFLDKRSTPVFWFTSFECKEVDELANFLKLSKIQTRRYFYPLHLQPCYADKKHIKNIDDDCLSSSAVSDFDDDFVVFNITLA